MFGNCLRLEDEVYSRLVLKVFFLFVIAVPNDTIQFRALILWNKERFTKAVSMCLDDP